jgi:hypothetical protein
MITIAGEWVWEADGAGLGDGFGAGEVIPLIEAQGVGVADVGDEGQEEE